MQASGFLNSDDGIRLYYETWGSGTWSSGGSPLIVPNGICLKEDLRPLAANRSMIAYDVRNRGLSETVTSADKLERGILNDVDDLETLRRNFGFDRIDLLGHSYMGFMVMLYAMRYPDRVNRIVLIGPAQPDARTQYSPPLASADGVAAEVFAKMGALHGRIATADPVEICRQLSDLLRVIFVAHPEDAVKINWMRCELPNERNFMPYFSTKIVPSMNQLNFSAADYAKAAAPVLIVHGDKDRSAPYGGGRDWAMRLPDARLLTVPDAAHGPWIEAPETVFGSVEEFLSGTWPDGSERIATLDLVP
jgi:pimeloyl-ACP methyl ester carboxylesterase